MPKKYYIYGMLILASILGGCKSDNKDKDNGMTATTIFTSQIKNDMTEIVYYANDNGIKLKNKDDMERVYELLSTLSLSEVSSDKVQADGGIDLEINTDNSTLKVHLVSDIISINGKIYSYKGDAITEITKIYEPYFS
jgi:hypothetical protein